MNANPIEVVLESILNSFQVRAEIITRVNFCDDWTAEAPATPHGLFHIIIKGGCWITGPAMETPVRLECGDLIVFPAGSRHGLAAAPPSGIEVGNSSAETWMLCGKLDFGSGSRNPIFTALPAYFVVRAADSSGSFRQLADLLDRAAVSGGWGQNVMLNKLADSVFTMALCEYVRSCCHPRGLLAALADERLCRSLAAVHSQPGEDWTIQSMAKLAGMSRTTFAELFSRTMGQPPMLYVSTWRATEARRLLQDRKYSVARIAELMGYRSEAAFRRFFKRVEGVGAGRVRSVRRGRARMQAN